MQDKVMSLSRYLLPLTVLLMSLFSVSVPAAPDVRVVGLFNDQAVLQINGRQHVLKAGQTSPEGVKLLEANSESAVLQIEGERVEARLDGRVSARKQGSTAREVQVWRNTSGMYTTVGSINGLPVSFLVDTGLPLLATVPASPERLPEHSRTKRTTLIVAAPQTGRQAPFYRFHKYPQAAGAQLRPVIGVA